ncbi:barstar family protein [Streptomyces sp. 900105245]
MARVLRCGCALDLTGVTDKPGLTDRVARALALPDGFGRNRDALADSLCDHTVWPEGAVEQGSAGVAGSRPPGWTGLMDAVVAFRQARSARREARSARREARSARREARSAPWQARSAPWQARSVRWKER